VTKLPRVGRRDEVIPRLSTFLRGLLVTCIVGVTKDDQVIMGGDSCGSNNYDWVTVGNPKVFKVGDFMIGCTTSFRMIDLLRYHLRINPHHPQDSDDQFIRTDFIDNVIGCFRKGGFLETEDGVYNGGNFLVGYHGKLYEVQNDFSVLDCPNWGSSVGSGENAARGSLFTTRSWDDPNARVTAALEAAESVVPTVRGPFVIQNLS
jgi:hypothetical protein